MAMFLDKLLSNPEASPLLSGQHFSVDGTLLKAWASHASLERRDGEQDPPLTSSGDNTNTNPADTKRAKGDFRGLKISNKTHFSRADPDAFLARKSSAHPAVFSYQGHVLMENLNDLVVNSCITQADGYGMGNAAIEMAAALPGKKQKTIGADKGYDTKGFVGEMRYKGITPHISQNTKRKGGSAIDGRTTRHEGYAKSLNARKGIEKVFGWLKEFSGFRGVKHRGKDRLMAYSACT